MSLVAEGLSFAYRGRPVLDGLSFDVTPGRFSALLGRNGAGKSTLLKCICGLLRPSAGRVSYAGRDTGALSPKERARVYGYVPQSVSMRPGLGVMDVVLLGRGVRGRPRGSDLEAVEEILRWMNLEGLAFRPVQQLSGGERQRVLIARALAQEAPVLLLDEPTSSLDLRFQYDMAALLRRVCHERGVSILASIHDLGLASSCADEALMLSGGRLFARGRPADVLNAENVREVFRVEAEVLTVRGRCVVLPKG